MITYKKTMVALGIALIVVPQICNALDTEGKKIIEDFKTEFNDLQTNFDGFFSQGFDRYKLSDSSRNQTDPMKWHIFINNVRKYITKNANGDPLLEFLLFMAMDVNQTLVYLMRDIRDNISPGLNDEKRAEYNKELDECYDRLTKGKRSESTLLKETYYIPSKKDAQIVLIETLHYIKRVIKMIRDKVNRK